MPSSLRVLGSQLPGRYTRQIRHGERLTVRVDRSSGLDRYTLRIGDLELPVRSAVKLPVGGNIRVRAHWLGPNLTLKLENKLPTIKAEYVPSGQPRDHAAQIAVRALLNSGMSLDSGNIRHIVSVLTRRDRMDPQTARLISLIIDKKIEPTDAFVDALLDLGSRDENSQSGETSGRESTDDRDNERRNDEIEGDFAGTLRDQATPREYKQSHPLPLFNNMRSMHDHWIIVPFRLSRGSWDARGDIRIQISRSGTTSALVVNCETDGERLEFSMRQRDNRRVVSLPHRGGRAEASALATLSEKLQNLGVEIDDIKRDHSYDGFTDDAPEGIDSVDTLV